jgi:Tol biopolymer transport system component
MAWTPDGREVLSLHGGSMVRLSSADGSTTPVAIPAGWELTSLDVSPSGVVVAAGRADDRASLLTLGVDGAGPTVLLELGATEEVSAARWSPDGSSIAFVHRSTTAQDTASEAVYSVRSVTSTGAGARSLADLGACQCVGIEPALAWAPDGRLAVTTPFGQTQHLYTVGAAGRVPMDGDAVGSIAWRPGG